VSVKFEQDEAYTATETRLDCLIAIIRSGRWPNDSIEDLIAKSDVVMDWLNKKEGVPSLKVIKR